MQSLNETTLNFCLNNYELLFLGSWIIGTHESTINYDEVLEIHGPKFAESEFNEICDEVNRKNKRNETAANGKVDYIDDNKTVHWFVDDIVEQVAVTTHQMEYDFSQEYIKSEDDLFNNLKLAAETYAKAEQRPMCTVYSVPEIYQITKRTIANTRLILSRNEKLVLDKWENLDKLEERLNKGEKIFSIMMNYQGGGYDTYAIYAEDGFEDILNGMAAEEIYGECL